MADRLNVRAYSTNANGAVTPRKTLAPWPWTDSPAADIPGISDIAIAPDGTQWVLEKRSFAAGGPGWRLYAYAPGDTRPENVYGDDVNSPYILGLAGDGVMVGGGTTIATYPYAASNAPPLRTFRAPDTIYGFAEGNDGHLYVGRPGAVDVYQPTATGCCPLRSTVAAPVGHGLSRFTVGPDNSIYVTDMSNAFGRTMYVNVYASSGTLARRIGPLPSDYSGFGGPVIAVDAKNRLYVATNSSIYRFGPRADGAAIPDRVMTDAAAGRPIAMAIGPKL